MSGTEQTYHLTKEDVAKAESKASGAHGGNVPAGSDAAMLQSIIDKTEKDKPTIIAERQANLPLPDDPPGPSDFNSADQRTVNIGKNDVAAGSLTETDALREPATGDSAVRANPNETKTNVQGMSKVGREGEDNLSGLPNDAVTRNKKDTAGLADTTNQS